MNRASSPLNHTHTHTVGHALNNTHSNDNASGFVKSPSVTSSIFPRASVGRLLPSPPPLQRALSLVHPLVVVALTPAGTLRPCLPALPHPGPTVTSLCSPPGSSPRPRVPAMGCNASKSKVYIAPLREGGNSTPQVRRAARGPWHTPSPCIRCGRCVRVTHRSTAPWRRRERVLPLLLAALGRTVAWSTRRPATRCPMRATRASQTQRCWRCVASPLPTAPPAFALAFLSFRLRVLPSLWAAAPVCLLFCCLLSLRHLHRSAKCPCPRCCLTSAASSSPSLPVTPLSRCPHGYEGSASRTWPPPKSAR